MGDRRIHCVLRGDVQGVGLRWSVRERARELALTGTVRNLPDGEVEVVAEGSAERLEALKSFCYRGPHGARVTDMEVFEEAPTGELRDFEVRP